MRVDAKGFFLYWIDQNNELDILDIATIRDVRTGQYAKKPKVRIRITHYSTDYLCFIIILMCDFSISLIRVSLTFWQLQRKAVKGKKIYILNLVAHQNQCLCLQHLTRSILRSQCKQHFSYLIYKSPSFNVLKRV